MSSIRLTFGLNVANQSLPFFFNPRGNVDRSRSARNIEDALPLGSAVGIQQISNLGDPGDVPVQLFLHQWKRGAPRICHGISYEIKISTMSAIVLTDSSTGLCWLTGAGWCGVVTHACNLIKIACHV